MAVLTVPRAGWWLACAAALAALYAAVFAIVGSAAFARAPDVIALAATFDLTVTAALIVWWLGVRRGAVRPWLLVMVISWGVALARSHVPHAPLGTLVAAAGALEALSVGWLMIRIRRVARVARAARGPGSDAGPIAALEAGLIAARIPARAAAIIATELCVVWLAVTGWFRRPRGDGFAMTSSGWLLYAGVFGFLIAVETAALHIPLAHWNPLIAWISTASSLYALVWLAGDAHAIRLHPVAIRGDALRVTIGIRWRVRIPLGQIASVIATRGAPRGALDQALNLALIEPSLVLALRAPIEVRGLLGRRRRADRIALTIDDVPGFVEALTRAGAELAAPGPAHRGAR